MADYIDLVLAKHDGNDKRPFLFQAPAWSNLQKGDRIIADTMNGEHILTVETTATIKNDPEDEFYVFALVATGAYGPLKKVLKKITYYEFEYRGDERNE